MTDAFWFVCLLVWLVRCLFVCLLVCLLVCVGLCWFGLVCFGFGFGLFCSLVFF